MLKTRMLCAALLALSAARVTYAADTFTLVVVQGTVVKFEKDVLIVQPDQAKAKPVDLHVTGTSRVSIAGTQTRETKMYMTQRETEAKSLEAKQKITAIYATLQGETVLLSAVVAAEEK